MLLCWFFVALFVVVLQGKFLEYQWAPIYPPLVAISALGFWNLASSRGERTALPAIGYAPAAAILSICMLRLAYEPLGDLRKWVKFMTGQTTAENYYKEFGHEDDPFSAGDDMAAQYIVSHTAKTDPAVVFGNNATITFLSARPNPTRFVFAMPLTRTTGMREGYRKEYLEKLNATPPTYIVVDMAYAGPIAGAVEDFPEFAQFLSENYELEKQFGLDVYHKRG